MPAPGSYPAKVTLADGRVAVIYDVNGYNALTAAGGSYSATATPVEAKAGTTIIVAEALNTEQSDTRPISAHNRGSKL